ncbi:hypothetical protein ACIO8F_31145 [Streptomyces sp. NPDC087228]|uniref:hypothetical protein n=2 Tax=Streptomyces TaxID=1883 RepID=UPI0033F6255C
MMRTRQLLGGIALGGAMLVGTAAAPAQAAAPVPTTAAGGWTMSIGGPIRSCASANCGTVSQTMYGDDIYWTSSLINSAGNRWYRVTYPASGYIYCGNITEPC